jgi:hypothetical protein
MPRLYRYVGQDDRVAMANATTYHLAVESAEDIRRWIQETEPEISSDGWVTATFVVDENGVLWIADRRSEHVACARGAPVLAAGEITFTIGRGRIIASTISNQSTGYCPEPESWEAVAHALDRVGIEHPGSFTAVFQFRRCPSCHTINIVKDGIFQCGVCGHTLPPEWNLAMPN